MSQPGVREIVMLAPTTITTSGTGPDINAPQGFEAAIFSVVTSTTSGTSPTINVYIQTKLGQPASTDTSGIPPTGTAIYDDVISFTQLTTNATKICKLPCGPEAGSANATTATTCDWAQADAALSAGSVRLGPMGGTLRVKYVVGGTSPSTILGVTVQLIPLGT